MKRILKLIKYIAVGLLVLFLIFTIGGLIIKNKGQKDINRDTLLSEGAKLALDQNGRKIEYFTYGSSDTNALVVINIHGSGLDGTFEKLVHQKSCKELNVRGISISLPGYGNTDVKIGRSVIDWASEDLNAVLNLENVNEFMITGHSQGNPHAMAAAFHFKERCVGLGLNAPLLPDDLTKEINIEGALGYEQLKTTEELKSPLNAWWFFTIYLATDLFSPKVPLSALIYADEKVEEEVELPSSAMISHASSLFLRSLPDFLGTRATARASVLAKKKVVKTRFVETPADVDTLFAGLAGIVHLDESKKHMSLLGHILGLYYYHMIHIVYYDIV